VKSLIEPPEGGGGAHHDPFAVRFVDGGQFRSSAAEPAFTFVFRNRRAYWRLAAYGHVGLLESYVDGDLDVEGSLAQALAAGMPGRSRRAEAPGRGAQPVARDQAFERESAAGAQQREFPLRARPEFYRLWLDDPLML